MTSARLTCDGGHFSDRYWKKRRAFWEDPEVGYAIRSELGRADNLIGYSTRGSAARRGLPMISARLT
jgi:hypothetical protein